MTPPTIVRFDPLAHSFAGFRTGLAEVDEFFHPRSDGIHRMREKRMGDIYVAVAADGMVVGCVAYTPRSAPNAVVRRLGRRLWGPRRQSKPMDRGNLDGESDLIIPAVRIVILGVRRESQRKGVGAALLCHVFSAVTAPFYYLHPLPQAVPFYQKFGFDKFVADQPHETRVVMFKVDGFPQ